MLSAHAPAGSRRSRRRGRILGHGRGVGPARLPLGVPGRDRLLEQAVGGRTGTVVAGGGARGASAGHRVTCEVYGKAGGGRTASADGVVGRGGEVMQRMCREGGRAVQPARRESELPDRSSGACSHGQPPDPNRASASAASPAVGNRSRGRLAISRRTTAIKPSGTRGAGAGSAERCRNTLSSGDPPGNGTDPVSRW